MKKMKPSVKAALVPTLVLTSTAAITYAVPGMINENTTGTGEKLKLEVERVDSDTVKVSLDNVQDIPKSLQFSIKLDGVVLQDGQNSIKDLIESEVQTRLNSNGYSTNSNSILTDYTYNQKDNTIDVLITSENSLPKVGNKIEIFELDVKKTDENTTDTYKVLPNETVEYKYVSNLNKEYNNLGVQYENKEIPMNIAPTIESTERYVTLVEGQTLTATELTTQLGLTLNHEDGKDNLELEVSRDGEVITEFTENTPGIYELELTAVKDENIKSEAIGVQVNVVLDNVTEEPTITRDGKELTNIELNGGNKFTPLENVKAVDAKGRDVKVDVKVDQALDLDPDQDTIYVLTYTATDIYGNTAEKQITLKVAANQAPVISGVIDHTITVGDTFDPKADVTVKDDKDQNIELKVESDVNTKIPGTYKVSYSATDSGGKTARAQSTVTVHQKMVEMNRVPVITAANQTIKVGDEFDPKAGVTAYDYEDKDLTKDIKIKTNEVDRFTAGTYKVVYIVTDSKGATATKEITVTVLPKLTALNRVPVITASDKVITVGTEFNPLEGVTAKDEEDGNLTNEIKIVENEVNSNRVGKYLVTYQVTDKGGAKSTKTITVTVNPKPAVINAAPTIEAVDKVITVGDKFNALQGVKASDKEDLDLTHKVEVVENTVDTTQPGNYTVTYRVTDSGGATTTKTINVTVLMKLVAINYPPEIRATDKVIKLGSTFNPKENIVAYDREDLDISHKLEVIENTVNPSAEGDYTVKYRVTDSGGATVTKVITVTVKSDIVLATNIEINNKEDNKVYVNGSKAFTASLDEAAELKDIEWKISDSTIAELRMVRNEARIVAKATGEVTLTAFTTDGSNLSDTITINVVSFEEDSEVPSHVKDVIDTDVLTPMSGLGIEESPLEFEVKDITVNQLDTFLDNLESLSYKVLSIDEDDEFTTYKIKVANKVALISFFTSNEDTYLTLKVSKTLDNAAEINDRLGKLSDNSTQQPVNTKPAISIDGLNTHLTVGDTFNPVAGVSAFDKEDGDLTDAIQVSGSVDTTKAGTYTLTYTVKDLQGEEVSVTVDIVVSEAPAVPETPESKGEKPVIKVTSSMNTITVGDTFDPLAGISAYDKEDGDLTSAIQVSGSVDTTKAGQYQLTYSVQDKDGNSYTFVRTINVVEKEANKEENKENTSNPQTGYTAILGYIGVAATAVGGVLLSKKKRNK